MEMFIGLARVSQNLNVGAASVSREKLLGRKESREREKKVKARTSFNHLYKAPVVACTSM